MSKLTRSDGNEVRDVFRQMEEDESGECTKIFMEKLSEKRNRLFKHLASDELSDEKRQQAEPMLNAIDALAEAIPLIMSSPK